MYYLYVFLSVLCMKNLFRRLFAVLRAIAETGESKCQLVSTLSTEADHFVLMHMNEQFLPVSARKLRTFFSLQNIKNK